MINFKDLDEGGRRPCRRRVRVEEPGLVLIGLRRAPQLAPRPGLPAAEVISLAEVIVLVAPATALGSLRGVRRAGPADSGNRRASQHNGPRRHRRDPRLGHREVAVTSRPPAPILLTCAVGKATPVCPGLIDPMDLRSTLDERRTVAQDQLPELLQPRPGIDAALVGQDRPDPGDRSRSPRPAAAQDKDQLLPGPFVQRIGTDAELQLRHQFAVTALAENDIDQLFGDPRPLAGEFRRLRQNAERFGQVSQLRLMPDRQGLPQQLLGGAQVTGFQCLFTSAGQATEFVQIQFACSHLEHVPADLATQSIRDARVAAQQMKVRTQSADSGTGQVLASHRPDQESGGHAPILHQQKHGHELTKSRSGDEDPLAGTGNDSESAE